MQVIATPRYCQHDCDGVALVLVLWMLALLSIIAGNLVFSTRTDLLVEGNFAAQAKAEAAADAGVYKAIYEMSQPPTVDIKPWRGDGVVHPWQFADCPLEITIVDESGRIDLNAASPALLQGLFRSLGRADADAEALADAIVDWRDADDLRSPHGAENEDYIAAGRSYGPANAPFEAVEELRQVLGIDEQLFLRAEPLLTVHSHHAGINTAVASRQVLLAIPDATPELVDTFIAQRNAALAEQAQPPLFPLAPELQSGGFGAIATILVRAELGDNMRFFREATVRLGGNSPPVILAWRKPMVPSANTPPVASAELP